MIPSNLTLKQPSSLSIPPGATSTQFKIQEHVVPKNLVRAPVGVQGEPSWPAVFLYIIADCHITRMGFPVMYVRSSMH